MPTDTFKDVIARRNQILWLSLAFQSGFMNAGGFLACHSFVSHMTGYGTNVGIALGERRYLGAFELAMAPLFFLAGAAYSGWLVDRRVVLGQAPMIRTGIVTLAVLNFLIFAGEELGYLGEFGEPLVLQRDFVLLFSLCFACGLQNGLFTGLTGGQVRTTHLTGPITDIGLNLSKISALDRDDPERRRLAIMNWLRTKIVVAFSGGSMTAILVFPSLTYAGFAIPCVISITLVWYVRKLLRDGAPAASSDENRSNFAAVAGAEGGP